MEVLIPSSTATGESTAADRRVPDRRSSAVLVENLSGRGIRSKICTAIFLRLVCLGITLAALIAPHSGFAAETSKEYNVKAAFLYNFARFVEWPPSAFATADSPFVFGILGENPFGNALEEALAGRAILGRKLAVHRFDHAPTNEPCHLLFISASEKKRLPAILTALQGRNILIVGEEEAFARSGGSIAFVMDAAGKLRFQINTEAARKAGLRVNAQMLKLAIKVWGESQ